MRYRSGTRELVSWNGRGMNLGQRLLRVLSNISLAGLFNLP